MALARVREQDDSGRPDEVVVDDLLSELAEWLDLSYEDSYSDCTYINACHYEPEMVLDRLALKAKGLGIPFKRTEWEERYNGR